MMHSNEKEFVTTLHRHLQETYQQRDPNSTAAIISDDVYVETYLNEGYGPRPLLHALQHTFKQLPEHFSYCLSNTIVRSHSIHLFGKITPIQQHNKTPAATLKTTDSTMLFLFDKSDLCKKNLTHVFFYITHQQMALPTLTTSTHDTSQIIELTRCISQKIKYHSGKEALTSREIQCLSLYINCKTAKEASQVLHIATRTVEKHITNIMDKLDCHAKHHLFDLMNHCQCVPLLFELHNMLYSKHLEKS